MTISISDFVSDIRKILRDTDSTNYHVAQPTVLNAVVDAITHLRSVRPESKYVGLQLTDITFPTDENELSSFEVTFDERWRLGIVYFAAARCYEADVTDTVNMQLAQQFFKQADAVFAQ